MQRGYLNNEVASERKASHDEEVKKRELCHEVLHFRLDRNQLSESNRRERLFGKPVVNMSDWKNNSDQTYNCPRPVSLGIMADQLKPLNTMAL